MAKRKTPKSEELGETVPVAVPVAVEDKNQKLMEELAGRITQRVVPQSRIKELHGKITETLVKLGVPSRVAILDSQRLLKELDEAVKDRDAHPDVDGDYERRRILRGLMALSRKWGDNLEYDEDDDVLSLCLGNITLETSNHQFRVNLGDFSVKVKMSQWGTENIHDGVWVYPHDPNPPRDGGQDIVHPHVRRDGLEVCFGEAETLSRTALKRGSVGDLFGTMRRMLENYNPGSPYHKLELWESSPCHECGTPLNEDTMYECGHCGHTVCEEHYRSCSFCDVGGCSGCVSLHACFKCGELGCPECVKYERKWRRWLCGDCVEDLNNDPTQTVLEEDPNIGEDEHVISIPAGTLLAYVRQDREFWRWRWIERTPDGEAIEWWSEHNSESLRRQGYRVQGVPGTDGILEPIPVVPVVPVDGSTEGAGGAAAGGQPGVADTTGGVGQTGTPAF
jgi:hypothetical protein